MVAPLHKHSSCKQNRKCRMRTVLVQLNMRGISVLRELADGGSFNDQIQSRIFDNVNHEF